MKYIYKNTGFKLRAMRNVWLLMAVLFFCFGQMSGQTMLQPGIHFEYNSLTHTITGFNFDKGLTYITIPRDVSGDVILAIADEAFKYSGSGTQLTQVEFASGSQITTIGNDAFRGNALSDGITLPNTVTFLGERVFYNCDGLTTINIASLTSLNTLPRSCFEECRALVTVTLPNGLQIIESNAFYNCGALGTIIIPSTVTEIRGYSTFYNVSNTCVIDMTSKQPGYYAGAPWWGYNAVLKWHPDGENNSSVFIFNKNTGKIHGFKTTSPPASATDVVIPNQITVNGVNYNVTGLGDGAFSNRTSRSLVRNVTFESPRNVPITEIPIFAFMSTTITSIAFPATVTNIGFSAFRSCTGLTANSISSPGGVNVFPVNLTTIEDAAFMSTRFATITFPDGFRIVGSQAFSQCINLTTAIFSGNQVTGISNSAFGSNNITNIYLSKINKDGVPNAPWGAVNATVHWKNGVTPPATCTSGNWTFVPASNRITRYTGPTGPNVDLVIPSSLSCGGTAYPIYTVGNPNSIDRVTSTASPQFKSVTFSNGIRFIGNSAFRDAQIGALTLGNTIEEIKESAFQNCGLTALTFPESIKSLSNDAFANNNFTGSITIQGNVNYVSLSAFSNNSGIRQFLIKQYRNMPDDLGAYNPTAIPPKYFHSPTAVQGNAPFGASNANGSVFYMDDPVPQYEVIVTPNTTNNTAIITLKATIPFPALITGITAGAGMPAVTLVSNNPWTATMTISAALGNGNYTFATAFSSVNGNQTHYYTYPLTAFHDVIYNGNGHTAGNVPATANYVQGYAVPISAPLAGFAKTGCTFLGWATSPSATVPAPAFAWNGTSFPAPGTFPMSSANVTLYAVWRSNVATTPFEIWNWEDLAWVMNKQAEGYTEFKLMQNLGAPDDPTVGDGTGCPYSGNEVYGWYGYEGYFGNLIIGDVSDYDPSTWTVPSGIMWWDILGWIPIGTYREQIHSPYTKTVSPFTGNFNGQNHSISGLWTNYRGGTLYWESQGLFGLIDGATIENLGVNTSDKGVFDTNYNVGVLVADARNSTITNCYTFGNISSHTGGGLVGSADNSAITNCSSVVDVNAIYGGGLVGSVSNNSTIENCYAIGDITTDGGGGLVATVTNSSITNCYATGNVTLVSHLPGGGLVGRLNNGSISNCYATGAVTGNGNQGMGGLGGDIVNSTITHCYATGTVNSVNRGHSGGLGGDIVNSTITNCYATGNVKSNSFAGGLLGNLNGGSISNCYAFNCKIECTDTNPNHGRIIGVVTSGNSNTNYANDAMELFWNGVHQDPNPGYNTKDGINIGFTAATNPATYTGDWENGNWAFTPYVGYSVAAGTNLPILAAFNPIDFPAAQQKPQLECRKPVYEIWNWADLGYLTRLNYFGQLDKYEKYVLMQDLGVPGSSPANYGDGTGCPYDGDLVHPERKFGYYGYQNYINEASFNPLNITQNELRVGGDATTPLFIMSYEQPFEIGGKGWTPIAFSEHFDGQEHTINGLWIDRGNGYQGLFSTVSDATIENLGVNISEKGINGGTLVGGLAAITTATTITNCYVTGNVKGVNEVGGLVGRPFHSTTITNCYTTGNVSGLNEVGGLAGDTDRTTITNSFATGAVSYYATGATSGIGEKIGGLVGDAGNSTNIKNCFATGTVTGLFEVGGLVGHSQNDITITNSHAEGNVSGQNSLGGLVAYISNEATITNCYATGDITGDVNYAPFDGSNGGLIGYVEGEATFTDCYATGNVIGSWCNGGLIGATVGSNVINCYAEGNVSGKNDYVGGLVGITTGMIHIENSHATGAVSGEHDYVGGLMGYVGDMVQIGMPSEITNCYATGAVSGNDNVGGLIGYFDGIGYGIIEIANCHATGAVSGNDNVGGLLGYAQTYTTITNCYAEGDVNGNGAVGGLAGYSFTHFTNCYATGDVSGGGNVGGLFGYISGDVTKCYATGNVNGGGNNVGGLVGSSNQYWINHCYATGNVSGGGEYVGGILGTGDTGISNCYATGTVTGGNDYVGGIVGDMSGIGDIVNCYAFNPRISTTAITSMIGRISGNGHGGSNNYALECMRVNGASVSSTDPTSQNGANIDLATALLPATYTGDWATGNWAFTSYAGYHVAPDTNLPILAVFTPTAFPEAVQKPKVADCDKPVYEIWNWADLGYINTMIYNEVRNIGTPDQKVGYYDYVLMQNLGVPGQGNYGDGSATAQNGMVACPYEGERKNGYYGYQNWTTATGFDGTTATANTLKVGGDATTPFATIPTTELPWDPAKGWIPLGTYEPNTSNGAFTGDFDGQGFEINGLWMNRTTFSYVGKGLFGEIERATIENLGVNISEKGITADCTVGGLAGGVDGSTITNCYTTGNVKGWTTGGLIGSVRGSIVKNCYATGNIVGNEHGPNWMSGGLVGVIDNSGIINCYATGNVSGGTGNGGLVGSGDYQSGISHCYATGNVASDYIAGGLVGDVASAFITNCYATGTVNADYSAGGLAGIFRTGGIYNNYATGAVSSNFAGGGLVGELYSNGISDCYAFNSSVEATGSNVGRVFGRSLSGTVGTFTNNQALECMKVNGATVSSNNAASKDGKDISLVDAITPSTYSSWLGTAWTFDYGTYSFHIYNVITTIGSATNLPILAAFNKTDFPNAVQPPRAACEKPIFEIWNWADLGYVKIMVDNQNRFSSVPVPENQKASYYDFVLMQDLGVPGQSNYGDGSATAQNGMKACPYEGERKNGYYGYQNWITATGFDGTTATANTLKVGGNTTTPFATIPTTKLPWNESEGWVPIGIPSGILVSECEFASNFDGQNFEISGLWINRPSTGYQGLFGYAWGWGNGLLGSSIDRNGIVIENLGVNISEKGIIGGYTVGGLVGNAHATAIRNCHTTGNVSGSTTGGLVGFIAPVNDANPDITNCYTTGNISGEGSVGGLVGTSEYNVTIANCHATGDISGGGNNVGGLIGNTFYLTLKDSYATGAVSGYQCIGGLVGHLEDGVKATNCYATGTVSGTNEVGGLVGHFNGHSSPSEIANSYATGTVNGTGDKVGGLMGYAGTYVTITDCHATGAVSGGDNTGGFVGHAGCYTDITKCHAEGAVTGGNNVGGFVGLSDNIDCFGDPRPQSSNVITNCYANGNVTGANDNVGGLVGYAYHAEITNCYATGAVVGSNDYTGGLIGQAENDVTITNCYATGKVIGGHDYVGGFVGYTDCIVGIFTNCYATGAVSGHDNVGGFVGAGIHVYYSYATGRVTGHNNVGGFAGVSLPYGIIGFCYATGTVQGNDNVGGILGGGMCGIRDCYAFNCKVTGISNVGRIYGENQVSASVNNYAYEDMVLLQSFMPLIFTPDPNDMHGGNIDFATALLPTAYPYFTTDNWAFTPYAGYNIAAGTNLPILSAFTPADFPASVQNPKVGDCMCDIAAPVATTPQTFCESGTVANLQATGLGVIWYSEPIDGIELLPTASLMNGRIYYAAQTTNGCESPDRTAVKVILDDNVLIDIPDMPGIYELCAPATLADVPTYGNTNLKWYAASTGGTPLNAANITLTEAGSPYTFYAGISGGTTCESVQRAEVIISITNTTPNVPIMETPQTFCNGALVGNIAVPNNKIVWYFEEFDNVPIDAAAVLIDGHTYWAAQKAGSCESATRKPVNVIIDRYPAPITLATQSICGMQSPTLSDLMVTGTNIKWYYSGTTNPLPLTTFIQAGDVFWVTQSLGTCESNYAIVTIIAPCNTPFGTVFPFVYTGDATYDTKFVTTAKLYAMPPSTVVDKLGYIRKQTPLQTVRVEYYNCTTATLIAGVPQHPGTMGLFNNAGMPIQWHLLGYGGTPNNTTGECPDAPVGKYIFENVASGNYILELSRQGFLSCYAIVNVTGSNYIGHRELIGGDVNGDLIIDGKDVSATALKNCPFGHPSYEWKYDLTGNKNIGDEDVNIIRINMNAGHTIYLETKIWVNP